MFWCNELAIYKQWHSQFKKHQVKKSYLSKGVTMRGIFSNPAEQKLIDLYWFSKVTGKFVFAIFNLKTFTKIKKNNDHLFCFWCFSKFYVNFWLLLKAGKVLFLAGKWINKLMFSRIPLIIRKKSCPLLHPYF